MLEGADRVWVANRDFFPGHGRPDAVRDNSVVREVSSANHITRPACRDGTAAVLKKGLLIAVRHQFGT